MVAQQRSAVFNLAVAASALGIFIVLRPAWGPIRAQAAFGLLGITALAPLFMRRRVGRIVSDERDETLFARSIRLSMGLFWLVFAAALLGYYFGIASKSVSIDMVPMAIWSAWVTWLIVQSIVLLVLYQRS